MKAIYLAIGAVIAFGIFLTVPKQTAVTTKEAAITTKVSVNKATIKTDKGEIILELYQQEAPKTVSNFAEKAKAGYFDGLAFHRVEDWVIQGGDPLSRDKAKEQLWGTGGGSIETELNDKPFVDGSLGVARGQDIKVSNDSQFFITKGAAGFLDKQYTNFGKVTSGLDVVNSIEIGDKIISITVE